MNLWKIPKPFALSIRLFRNGKQRYTWEDWREDARKAYPIRYFLNETLPKPWWRLVGLWRDAKYWVRCHTYNRYHMIDIRSAEYRWGWQDVSEKLLLASFALLCQFVEGEDPFDVNDWSWSEGVRHAAAEIRSLYKWWREERAIALSALEACNEDGYRYRELTDQLQAQDDANLERLMKIRHYLWT